MPELASEERSPSGRAHAPDLRRGVFETLLVLDGRPVELDAHLDRLTASLGELFPDRSAPDAGGEIEACARNVDLGAIRATVVPAGRSALELTTETREADGAFPAVLAGEGPCEAVELHSFAVAGGIGAHKWADRSLLDAAQAKLPDSGLPLIVDSDDTALEASRANVFAERDGVLVTPRTDGRILPGVTRARAIEVARAGGMVVREESLSHDDLLEAGEVFLTGSVRGVEAVLSVDDVPICGSGELTTRVASGLLRRYTA